MKVAEDEEGVEGEVERSVVEGRRKWSMDRVRVRWCGREERGVEGEGEG